MFRIEMRRLLVVHFAAQTLQLGEDVLETLIVLHAVGDQLVNRLRHGIVHVPAYRIRGETALCVGRVDEPQFAPRQFARLIVVRGDGVVLGSNEQADPRPALRSVPTLLSRVSHVCYGCLGASSSKPTPTMQLPHYGRRRTS